DTCNEAITELTTLVSTAQGGLETLDTSKLQDTFEKDCSLLRDVQENCADADEAAIQVANSFFSCHSTSNQTGNNEDECEKAVYKLQGVVSKGDSLEKICAENNAVAKKCTSAELLLLLFSLRASDQDAIAKAIGQCS
ncbi:hypothetical protein TYRP_000816, partial [Tyrophagus putrescentiae]